MAKITEVGFGIPQSIQADTCFVKSGKVPLLAKLSYV
jgi:hypothetical protein